MEAAQSLDPLWQGPNGAVDPPLRRLSSEEYAPPEVLQRPFAYSNVCSNPGGLRRHTAAPGELERGPSELKRPLAAYLEPSATTVRDRGDTRAPDQTLNTNLTLQARLTCQRRSVGLART